MKAKFGQLLLWHTIFIAVYYLGRDMAHYKNFNAITDFRNFNMAYIEVTTYLVFTFYAVGAYWIMLRFKHEKWYVLLGLMLLCSFLPTVFRYLTQEVISLKLFGFRNYNNEPSLLFYYGDNLVYAVLHIVIGVIFFYIQYSKHKEQQAKVLIIENQKTELAYLRSQVNPHFLFNTLNNVYSLVYQKSDKALKAMERLTSMLRYGLYENAEHVAIEREIEQLNNFIELEMMRYDYPLSIAKKVEIDSTYNIPPFLFIPFVENAFKHGDLLQPLCIDLSVQTGLLRFVVKNAKKRKQKDQIGGIGLENIRKRLELTYGKHQQLDIEETAETYKIQLQIQL